MSGNIEDFLRKAAQQRKQRRQQPGPREQTPRPAEPVEIVEPEVVSKPLVEKQQFQGSVASHVSKHLSNAEFAERISHLGEDVGLSDERLEEHLHDAFDHRVGQLSGESITDDMYEQIKQQSEMANTLARMLQSPYELRNAIVLSEILERPEHRW